MSRVREKMNKHIKYSVLIILGLALFIGLVKAQPIPIGTTLQPEPFDSNPSAYALNGFTATQVPTTSPPNWWDGSLGTPGAITLFSSLSPGTSISTAYVNVTGFKTPVSPVFNPGWVDIQVSYSYSSVAASAWDSFRLEYTVGTTNPWKTLLPDTVLQNVIPQTNNAFSQLANPTGAATWSWTDIASLRVRIFFTKSAPWDFKTFVVWEIWATIHNNPLPPTDGGATTLSVQPRIVYGVDSTSAVPGVFVEVYVENAHDMFTYEFNMTVDPTVLTPLEADPLGPWASALGGSPIIDPSATPSWIYVSFGMPPPVPVGSAFTGNAPVCRIYFLVNVPSGASDIIFKPGTVILGDSQGIQIPATIYNGHYQAAVPPVPEFPLGIDIVMLLAPAVAIVYLWRARPKKRVN